MKPVTFFSDQCGFTIIEAVVAIAVFSIGILGVQVMQLTSLKGNSHAYITTLSLAQTSDRIEQLLNTPYTDTDLDIGSHTPAGNVSWQVVAGTAANTKKITITVDQNVHGRSKQGFVTIEYIKAEVLDI